MTAWNRFVNEVAKAADDLGEPSLAQLARSTELSGVSVGLSLLVVGRPDTGGWPIAMRLAHAGSDWESAPMDWLPAVSITRGINEEAILEHASGTRQHISLADSNSVAEEFQLIGADPGKLPRRVDLTLPAGASATPSVRWARLDYGWSDQEWATLLAGVDYVLVLTRDNQLLTVDERRFLAEQVVDRFGLSRCALVVTESGTLTVPQSEEVHAALERYLAACTAEPMVIEIGGHSEDLRNLQVYFESSYQSVKLASLAMTARQYMQRLSQLSEARDRELRLSLAGDEMTRARLEADKASMGERISLLEADLEFRLLSVLRHRYDKEIHEFANDLRVDLSRDIRGAKNLHAVVRHVPHYLADTWKVYLVPLLGRLQAEMATEITTVLARAEEFGVGAQAAQAGSNELKSSLTGSLRRTPQQASSSRWSMLLGAAGLWTVWFQPALGLGLIGASKAIQWVVRNENLAEEQARLAEAAELACGDIEREARKEVTRWISSALDPARNALKDASLPIVELAPAEATRLQPALERWRGGVEQGLLSQVEAFENQWRENSRTQVT